MKITKYALITLCLVALIGLCGVTTARADGFLPIVHPYESVNDSPLKSFPSFTLVDMTTLPNGLFSAAGVVGVTVTPDGSIIGPGPSIDSVDGKGNNGHSLFSGSGSTGFTFTFDPVALGFTPTAAGIVWTDGILPVNFSAIDANGVPIPGGITDSTGCDFTCGDGDPLHFRFYGVEDSVGIKSITITSNGGGGIEVDHLQFAQLPSSTVPEPSSLGLTLSAMGFLLVAARRGK